METTFKIDKHVKKNGIVKYTVIITKENASWTEIIDMVKDFV